MLSQLHRVVLSFPQRQVSVQEVLGSQADGSAEVCPSLQVFMCEMSPLMYPFHKTCNKTAVGWIGELSLVTSRATQRRWW